MQGRPGCRVDRGCGSRNACCRYLPAFAVRDAFPDVLGGLFGASSWRTRKCRGWTRPASLHTPPPSPPNPSADLHIVEHMAPDVRTPLAPADEARELAIFSAISARSDHHLSVAAEQNQADPLTAL